MTQAPSETFRKYRPHVGDTISYMGREVGTVTTIENGLCWHTGDQSGPFIWCFRDGLNALHDWKRKAGGKVAYCPGVNQP